MPPPDWQRWLLPERPGMPQFLVGAIGLLLPVAARGLGPEWIIPAMGVAATIGGGLGLGWLFACGRVWLRRAPVTSLCVLVMALGCLGHLYIMPRWEVMLRAHSAIQEFIRYRAALRGGEASTVPSYDAGPNTPRFRLLDPPAPGARAVIAYTPEPLRRWTPFGYRDSCYLVMRADGSASVLKTRDLLLSELAANSDLR